MKTKLFLLIAAGLLNSTIYAQWFPQGSGTSAYLSGVFFIDSLTGWAAGNSSTVLKTTNGGNDWISSANGITSNNLSSIQFINNSVDWAAGQNLNIFKTTNGGSDWSLQAISSIYNSDLVSLFFLDVNTGWTIANHQYSPNLFDGHLYKTTNGGLSWEFNEGVIDERIYSICFVNNNIGWAVGTTIIKTTNGGDSWGFDPTDSDDPFNPEFYSVFFINENIGWIAGENTDGFGQIHKSTDGGDSWTVVHQDSFTVFNSVYFINENTGWCAGESGTILYTTDGGTNWTEQVTNSNEVLSSVFFSTDNIGWVVGSAGTILKTINAGTPVELISFSAEIINNNVSLNWSTATEINNSGFEIERSHTSTTLGMTEWEKVGFIDGFGTTTEIKSYSFVDKNLPSGKYSYRLKQIDFDGSYEYSNVVEVSFMKPTLYSLEQNYPNPFNPTTKIKFTVADAYYASPALVRLFVYDVVGNEIATLVNEYKPAGSYEVEFNGSNLSSGVYYFKLSSGGFNEIKKMVLMK